MFQKSRFFSTVLAACSCFNSLVAACVHVFSHTTRLCMLFDFLHHAFYYFHCLFSVNSTCFLLLTVLQLGLVCIDEKVFFGESVTKCIWKTNETRTVHWKNLTTTNNSNNNTFAIHFGNWNMSNSWLIIWSNAAHGRLNKTKCQKCVGRGKGRPLPPYKANSKLLQWSIHKFNKLLSARI